MGSKHDLRKKIKALENELAELEVMRNRLKGATKTPDLILMNKTLKAILVATRELNETKYALSKLKV